MEDPMSLRALAAAALMTAGAVLVARFWNRATEDEEAEEPPTQPPEPTPEPAPAQPEGLKAVVTPNEDVDDEPTGATVRYADFSEDEDDVEEALLEDPEEVDGVTFATPVSTLEWLNEADIDSLRAIGLTGKAPATVLDRRPFATLQEFADAPGIGPKSLLRVADQTAD